MSRNPALEPKIPGLFDSYVHGLMSWRQFLDRAAAARQWPGRRTAVLEMLSPNYALARQVAPDDEAIVVTCEEHDSSGGGGRMRGYLAPPGGARGCAGKRFREYTNDNSNRGFHNDTRPCYDKAAADLAWQRTIEFFRRNLV